MRDNYTPLHNEILEALCKINLSPYETRVLFAIWRKTYGFVDRTTGLRKKVDYISLSQFVEITGLDKRHVSRALRGLKNKNVISRDDKKTGFSKAFMKLMSSVEMIKEDIPPTTKVPVEMIAVISKDDDLSSVEGHTKEKKETITKENTIQYGNPEITLILNSFKSKLGYTPFESEKVQRHIAQNIRQLGHGFISRYGLSYKAKRGVELTFNKLIEDSWIIYLKNDYASQTNKLMTFKQHFKKILETSANKLGGEIK